MFVCFYCHNDAKSKNKKNVEFNSFNDLQAHWSVNHGSQKFQFIAIGAAACFHCDKVQHVDSFQSLLKHHQNHHESERFTVVDQQNRSKCGLCQRYIAYPTAMMEHFKRDHQPHFYNGVFNPICFTQNEVDWLLKLGLNNNLDKSGQLEHFQCGICQKLKDTKTETLERHLETHIFDIVCKSCKFATEDIDELISHELEAHSSKDLRSVHKIDFMERLKRIYFRTKLLFSNGLVVFKHNVLKTSFDDLSEFVPFIEHFAKQKFDEGIKSTKNGKCTISSNSFDAENTTSEKNAYYQQELLMQQCLWKDLCVSGILGIVNDKDVLTNFILDICKVIGANITKKDISHVQNEETCIIVTMKTFPKKKEILKAWEDVQNIKEFTTKLRTFQINGISLSELTIEMHLTEFFKPLCDVAQMAKNRKQIHKCWITNTGLNVKVKSQSKPEIVWSKADLMKLIERNNISK